MGSKGRLAAGAAAIVLATTLAGGCGEDERDLFVVRRDAGPDVEPGPPDADPGFDPTLGGPCTEDAQCDDGVACTYDRCDTALSRCRNVPDDAQCDDGQYCNGRETCVIRKGCAPGPVVTCQDDNVCTVDRCVEATKSCTRVTRDVDGDGDPDDHCVGQRDCNDVDPTVSSQLAEVCGNGKDDNCNGQVDEQPCASPANDVCATALAVSAPGTFLLSTVASKKDYPTSCTVQTPAAAKDIVLAITAPAGGGAQDVEIWATSADPNNEVAVAVQGTCGQSASELGCGHTPAVANARTIARSVAAGSTVYAVVTTQKEGAVDVKIDLRAPAPKPANESCGAPQPVAIDVPTTVSLIDPGKDLASSCDRAKTGELSYSFTLTQPSDVRIFASTLAGTGQAVVSLRDGACTGELRCRVGTTPPLFARNLPTGTHVFTVAGTNQIDASVLVKTYPPTSPPANQACATAPAAPINSAVYVDLSANEDAIKNGCLPGGPAAAYDLTLTEPSDVLVIGRFPTTELGSVSINGPGCTTADLVAPCAVGPSPVRLSRRNLPAGTYKIGIADETGQTAQLSVLVRPTSAPVIVGGADNCTSAVTVPAAGGFLTGNTADKTADFDAGCDAPGMPMFGAKDQILRLDLAQRQRVVFDMSGSFFTTLLDVRKGPTCPGAEVEGLCYVGFGGGRSFLERTLEAGTYWVQIDGYAGEVGAWNLDVRVLPPLP